MVEKYFILCFDHKQMLNTGNNTGVGQNNVFSMAVVLTLFHYNELAS